MLLRWALGFFVIALIAALFGYGGLAHDSASIAKVLFFIFLIVFAITFLLHIFSGPTRR